MLRAGSSRVAISPAADVDLLGYDFRQARLPTGNAGVADPLYAHALVIEDGAQRLVWLDLDLCIISVAFARQLRALVAADLGCQQQQVIVSCTHTHSGPWLQEPELAAELGQVLPHAGGTGIDTPGRRYADRLPGLVREAAQRAAGLTMPAELQYREMALGAAYCRRVPYGEGVRLCWNPEEQAELRPPAGGDPVLGLIDLRQRGGGRRWPLVAYGAHPVCLGKTSRVVSADWPGRMRELLRTWLPGAEPSFALGPCGDTHPWIATQEQHERVEPVARSVASAACLLAEGGGTYVSDVPVRAVERRLQLGGAEVDLVAWRLGPALLVAAPVELFAVLGAQLRRRLGRPVLIATNANGWTGYWPDAAAFPLGNYEVVAARAHGRVAGDGERLVEELAGLAGEALAD